MLQRVITLPEKMEVFHRDDQVLLFNLLNMCYCRIHEGEFRILQESLLGQRLADSFSSLPLETQQQIKSFILRLTHSGFLQMAPGEREEGQKIHSRLSSLFISLTRACNLRCPYCYAYGGDPSPEQMDAIRIVSLMDEARALGVERITFTGGEPLLYPDLFLLAEKGKKQGIEMELITNGTLIQEGNADELGLFDMVVVTLDGSTARVHDVTRGAGSFQQTLQGMSILREREIPVTVNTIINKNNYHDLYNIIEMVGQMGIKQHNTNVHLPMGRGVNDGLECSEEEIRAGRFQLGQSLQENMNRDYILKRIQSSFPIPYLNRKGCGAASTELYVNYDGFLYPCRLLQFSGFRAGNVKEESLVDLVLESEILKNCQRLYTVEIEECQDCSILNYCRGGCRSMHFLYSRDPFVNSPRICSIIKEDLELILWLKTGYLPTYYGKGEEKNAQ